MKTTDLKLISHKLCPYVQRARIVLEEKSIPHEITFIDLDHKPQWFLELSPLGKVPVLLVDGNPVFESSVIAEYLDETTPGSMLPEDAFKRATSRAWIEFASNTLGAIARFYNAADKTAFDSALDLLKTRFRTLESALGDGPYFNGGKFTLVDAAFAPVFRYFDVLDIYADFGLFTNTPKVVKWRNALGARPSVERAVVGDYSQLLHRFLFERNSYLSNIIASRRVA